MKKLREDKEPPSIVKNVMARPVITVNKECSVYEAAKIMGKKNIGCIVVTDKGTPVGIATERDLLQRVIAKGMDASKIKMKDIMSKPLVTIGENTPIINAIRVMEKKKVRHLPIIDDGKLVGIVTQRDLLRALAFHVIISFRPLL